MITCKGKAEILKMERATRIVQEVLAECVAACRPGVTGVTWQRLRGDISSPECDAGTVPSPGGQ